MNPRPPPIPQTAGRNRAGRRALVFCLTICLIPVLAFAGRHLWWSLKVRQRLAAIRAAQEPVSLAELNVYYPSVPSAENAALVYTQAFALLEQRHLSGTVERLADLPAGSGRLPEAQRVEIEQLVAENQDILGLLDKAASQGKRI